MDRLEKAKKLAGRTVFEIKDLAGEALKSGDYDSVEELVSFARQLEDIINATSPSAKSDRGDPRTTKKTREKKSVANSPVARTTRTKKRTSRVSTSPTINFVRRENELVKIAKSRGQGSYEHKAPFAALNLLVNYLSKFGDPERLIRMDDILPKLQSENGECIPSYQAYLCLAWLRREELVMQHGRRGYTVPDAKRLPQIAKRRFDNLPTKP